MIQGFILSMVRVGFEHLKLKPFYTKVDKIETVQTKPFQGFPYSHQMLQDIHNLKSSLSRGSITSKVVKVVVWLRLEPDY